MKVLWLVNIVMPELEKHLGNTPSVFGGWLTGAKEAVLSEGYDMVICTVSPRVNLVQRYALQDAVYYMVPPQNDSALKNCFSQILHDESPDLIHVFGTEQAFILPFLQVCDLNRTTLTLQGTVQITRDETCAGIPEFFTKDRLLHKFRRKLNKGGDSVGQQKIMFEKQAKVEEQILQLVRNADGCSEWGCAYIRSFNPQCRMFNCGALLRENFYAPPFWSYDACEQHSILTLMTRPIKGAHKLIEAMPYVLRQYPDAKLYIAGNHFVYREYTGLKKVVQDWSADYNWYVQRLIDRLGLRDHIVFLDQLNADEMKRWMRRVHVFVSPSAQEHLATALGEAMLTGTPCVSTSIGALQEMLEHGKDGYLYDFSEITILAQFICDIFSDKNRAEAFSRNGRAHAMRTYGQEENTKKLLDMYSTIINNRGSK